MEDHKLLQESNLTVRSSSPTYIIIRIIIITMKVAL